MRAPLSEADAQELSRRLNTKALYYAVSDTAMAEDFTHDLFKELDALEPGIRFAYIAGYVAAKAGEVVDLSGMGKDFEQVAYVALK